MTIDHADIPDHAENAPSAAEGWTFCEDYINANRGLPDTSSWEASEGTFAHMVRDDCLKSGDDAYDHIGRVEMVNNWRFEWTEDDAWLLQSGIDWIREQGGQFFGEQRVDITPWVGRDSHGRVQKGTLDTGIIMPDDWIIIEDLKWGRGVPVSAVRTKQLRIYGLAFWKQFASHITDPTTEFLFRIEQPRHPGGGGEWRCTLAELLEFGEWIKERAAANRAPNPPRRASPKGCMWCRRKDAPGGCGTLDAYVMEQLGMEFDDLDAPPVTLPSGITPERRRVLIDHKQMIEKWLERHEANCLDDALMARPTGGMKAVPGRKLPDKWVDPDRAQTLLVDRLGRDHSFTNKLISPTQASKKFSPDDFDWLEVAPLIQRGERPPILVSEEDPRPPITTADEFD